MKINAFELAKKGYMGGNYIKILNLNINEFNELIEYERYLEEMKIKIDEMYNKTNSN
jgi:hypothetical protein